MALIKIDWQALKKLIWVRITVIVCAVTLCIVTIKNDCVLDSISSHFKAIVEIPRLTYVILGLSLVISILYLIFVPMKGIAREHLLFKKLTPILSAPLTCLTYGTFINCGITLIYIISYDGAMLVKYDGVDKTTMIFTMVPIVVYSITGLGSIILDIINPKESDEGEIL